MGKQMEIVALIEIRSVFKDVDFTTKWPWDADFFPHLLGAMVVGTILVAFYRVLPRRIARIEEMELQRFIEFKKILAGFLFAYLIFLSGWSFFTWAYELYAGVCDAFELEIRQGWVERRAPVAELVATGQGDLRAFEVKTQGPRRCPQHTG